MAKTITPKGFTAPLGMYSHGMVADGGELVIVAGQVGVGAGGALVGPDVGSQTRQAFANVRAIVEAAGCTMADVVRLQTFLVSADDIPGFMKARQEIFPEYFPTRAYPPNTLLVISALVRPELKVEIEAMAVRRASAKKPERSVPASRSKRPPSSERRCARR